MKTVAIIGQKGGVGKTTAAIEIGFAAHQACFVTAIVDLDPQGTAANWAGRRKAEGPSVIGSHASRLGVILETVRHHRHAPECRSGRHASREAFGLHHDPYATRRVRS